MDYLLHGGSQINDELMADAKEYGIILPEHLCQSQDFSLWVEHLPVVDLFSRCMTQWRTGSNGVIGLDYGVVLQMANLYQTPDLPGVMEDLLIMELHARELLNEKR